MKSKTKELIRSGFGIVCLSLGLLGILEIIHPYIYYSLTAAIGIILILTEKEYKDDS